jgi:hypothetical protein
MVMLVTLSCIERKIIGVGFDSVGNMKLYLASRNKN